MTTTRTRPASRMSMADLAEENVALAAEYAGTSGAQARVAARASLASVGLADRGSHRPMEL